MQLSAFGAPSNSFLPQYNNLHETAISCSSTIPSIRRCTSSGWAGSGQYASERRFARSVWTLRTVSCGSGLARTTNTIALLSNLLSDRLTLV